MIEYRKAKKEEADELVDFINYVFSQAHRPHDFKKIDPKMYDSEYPFWEDHYVAIDNGRICATIALTKKIRHEMVYGYIGQVAVHPYHRGENHMRVLMDMAITEMKAEGYDYSILSGQRQRYGYFGYEPGDYRYRFEINTTNIRHVLAGKKSAVTIHNDENGYSFWAGEKKVGVWKQNALIMEDTNLTVDAIGSYFEETGRTEICIEVPLYETARAEALEKICENTSVAAPWERVLILNFRKFMEIGLRKRAQAGLCEDGELRIQVGEECFCLRILDGQVNSFDLLPEECVEHVYEHTVLQRMVLSLTTSQIGDAFPKGWFPISL